MANWVVGNLENALDTWNSKLNEIWTLITQSPQTFKDGTIWEVIVDINGAVQAIGLALLVIFFLVGIVKTCGSFAEVKKPESVLKLFVRFALSKLLITHGLELMLSIFTIIQGAIIVLACIIFSLFASSPPTIDTSAEAINQVWSYIGELAFNMLVLVGTIKASDRVVREMMGL